jgi:hypothetical protein
MVQPGQLKVPIAGPTFLSAAFPGLKILASLRKNNQVLAVRKFFIIGLYYCVVLTLTQWVSDAFTDRFSHSFLNNSMQVLDVGTSWGSVSLSIYFCINAVQTIISRMWGGRVAGRSRVLSGCFAVVGGATLLGTYVLYDQDIKVMVLLLGLSALGHDVFLNDRISDTWEADPALSAFRGFEKRKRLEDLEVFIEVLAYTAFVFLFPVLFFAIEDKYWILATGIIYMGLFFWKPKFEEVGEEVQPPIGYINGIN